MPRLVELYESLHFEGFEVVGINMDQDPERFHAAREELALPRQFLIDRQGVLRHGSSSLQELEERVRELLREGA